MPTTAIAVGLIVAIALVSIFAARVVYFLNKTTNTSVQSVINAINPAPVYAPGTIGYHLEHKDQTVNLLLVGYGGAENDAPYLTDSIMVVRLNPATKQVALISIPRDLWVSIDTGAGTYTGKINSAFELGTDESGWYQNPKLKATRYQGKDGGGHLAEDTISKYTGIKFDGYIGVDFKAFRDVVDALGGITIHMDGPLDDCHYPDYHSGYLNHGVPPGYACPPGAGIHFPSGTYAVNGEQALEIARSREASEPEQATDFGRARRQQMEMASIKQKAVSINGIVKAPQLMDALQKNFKTDLALDDLKALYDWGKGTDDSAYLHFALSSDLMLQGGINACANYDGQYTLCPEDRTYVTIKNYFSHTFPPLSLAKTHTNLEVVWSGYQQTATETATMFRTYGFQVADPAYVRTGTTSTTVYDFSGGQQPDQLSFLTDLLSGELGHAPVVVNAADPNAKIPAAITNNQGFVIFAGTDWRYCWVGSAYCKR